jgi:hypothetical protein
LRDDGAIIVGECKDKWEVRFNEVGRLISLSKALFPTASVPLLVWSGPQSTYSMQSAYQISWPHLSNSGIFSEVEKEPQSCDDFPEQILSSNKGGSAGGKNKTNKKKIGKSTLNLDDKQRDIIRNLLILVKDDSRPFNGGNSSVAHMLKQAGVPTKGLVKWINQHLADEMGFSIPSNDAKDLNTKDWIQWNDK